MTSKTMAEVISSRRKELGLTQKDLAERLNVSDKTVSRWERDDGAPDLSVIPVIAEIFDITCDELLRGERKSPQQQEITPENTLIIGDSPATDIKGANNAGLPCCWFNPKGSPAKEGLRIDYQIQQLPQVLDICGLK